MKFSDIQESEWEKLAPYVDTCLVPVTGLQGTELPWQVAAELRYLRDALDVLETPFKGRTVTYPAVHFVPSRTGGVADYGTWLGEIGARLKSIGFRHVVMVTAKSEEELDLEREALLANVDVLLRFTPGELSTFPAEARRRAADELTALWKDR